MPICSVCKAGYEENPGRVCPHCGVGQVSQRGGRRLNGLTELVKSWWVPLVVGGSVLAMATQQVRAGFKPCHWLDTTLNRSGCVAKVTLDADELDTAVEAVFSSPYVRSLVFSPDGQTIAVPREARLIKDDGRRASGTIIPVVNLDSGEVLRTLRVDETISLQSAPTLPATTGDVVFSPDGELLVASFLQGDSYVVYAWRVETGEREWKTRMQRCSAFAFSEDGQFVLCEDRRIAIADGTVKALESGLPALAQTALVQTTLVPSLFQAQRIAPDQSIQAEIEGNDIRLSSVWEGEEYMLATLLPSGELSESLFFSPDSQQLMAVGRDEEVVYLWRQETKKVEVLSFDVGAGYSLVWSLDGNRVGMAARDEPSNTLLIFELDRMTRL
ncbi:MAG: WD40 repeat domain-containing protein [Cyanobacteria bacterium J06597_16]